MNLDEFSSSMIEGLILRLIFFNFGMKRKNQLMNFIDDTKLIIGKGMSITNRSDCHCMRPCSNWSPVYCFGDPCSRKLNLD